MSYMTEGNWTDRPSTGCIYSDIQYYKKLGRDKIWWSNPPLQPLPYVNARSFLKFPQPPIQRLGILVGETFVEVGEGGAVLSEESSVEQWSAGGPSADEYLSGGEVRNGRMITGGGSREGSRGWVGLRRGRHG